MKAPKPAIPRGAPPGTVWFGGPIEWFSITLRISSEDLVPDDVTKVMDCDPDESQQKGQAVLREDGTVMRIAIKGSVNENVILSIASDRVIGLAICSAEQYKKIG
jgi:hypothetical protein